MAHLDSCQGQPGVYTGTKLELARSLSSVLGGTSCVSGKLLLLQPAWLRWLVGRRMLARDKLSTVRELVSRMGEIEEGQILGLETFVPVISTLLAGTSG